MKKCVSKISKCKTAMSSHHILSNPHPIHIHIHITDKLATANIRQATVNVDIYSSVVIGFLMIQ